MQHLVPDTYPAGGSEVDTTVIAGSVEIDVVVNVTKWSDWDQQDVIHSIETSSSWHRST